MIICLLSALIYPASSAVEKLTVATGPTWKALDVEQAQWTSNNYDDSWWEDVTTGNTYYDVAKEIWYPGSIAPDIVYFRKSFDVSATSFISGKLYTGLPYAEGSVDLYLNGNSLGTLNNDESEPKEIDILPYLQVGKNVIAAKVESKHHRWALTGTIRYVKSESSPAV